ncbi:MAG: zinc-ribbon domain-containing protein [Albidovulum sp.]|jgi:predicted Zn finger-like uncharacterized protein
MRLICPSCGAQYEVDESVIPDGGRDVQCSNCGHAWFQRSARQLSDEDAAPAEAEPPAPAAAAPAPAEAMPEPSAAWAEHDEEPEAPAEEAPEEAPVPERARRTLDDAVRNVLREEAEREAQARVAEGGPVEIQPDLGLAAAVGGAAAGGRGGEAPQDRVAKVGGDAQDYDEDALVSRAARRELLPDIEEINSTLRATSERGGEAAAFDAPETLARRRSGFRMGFSTALLAAAVLLGVYVLAPTLARTLPALEPALSLYVKAIDTGRQWLDARMQSLTQSLRDGTPD